MTYSLFVSFFPQLIAGPIVHHKEMISQFNDSLSSKINLKNIQRGLIIFSLGLAKKTIIADTFIVVVEHCFEKNFSLTFIEAWLGTISYTLQLYFDFSGYCDMAIGAALLFNIVIPENFISPYKSRNIQEFWRRWHATLGRWLRDYVYIPLGGSRGTKLMTSLALLATFVVGGIWHGAGWNFLIWGIAHGLGVAFCQLFNGKGFKLPRPLAVFLTFVYVHFNWVLFRAESFSRAKMIFSSMLSFEGNFSFVALIESVKNLGVPVFLGRIHVDLSSWAFLLMTFLSLIAVFILPNTREIADRFGNRKITPYVVGVILGIATLFISRRSEFLYFQF